MSHLRDFDSNAFTARLEASTRPMVVNVWGSWCIPCRSEAPLFAQAHNQFKDRIEFIGVDIQDSRTAAADFIEEFGIEYENLFDPTDAVGEILPGFGTPLTFFIAPGGEVIGSHFGVIDEQQLALQLDELLRH